MDEGESKYHLPRDFDPSSNLLGYLLRYCPNRIQSCGPYSLGQIVNLLHKVIKSRKLYDEGNPFIILCDEEMSQVFGVTAFHVSEICDRVSSHLTSPIETLDRCDRNLRVSDYRSLKSPSWGSDAAKARFSRPIPSQAQLFRVQPDFLGVLRQTPGIDKKRIIFDFNQLTNLFMKYILENSATIFDLRNVSVALVGETPLGEALQIKAFARSQARGIICSQLLPIPLEESLTLPSGSSSIKNLDRRGSPNVRERIKRNSLSKYFSNLEKSSEEETVYSAQGYETVAIGDSSTSEIQSTSSDDSFSIAYRDQYELVDSSEEERKSVDVCFDSEEDSDVNDVKIIDLLAQVSDFSNWADSDETTSQSRTSSSTSSCASDTSISSESIVLPKCLRCGSTIRKFSQYCQPCWDERKTWLAVRKNPRKRKRALISKTSIEKRPRTISDEPERSLDGLVVLGRSMSDPSPSSSKELIDSEHAVASASSGVGSLCSSQDFSSLESGPSQDFLLEQESQYDGSSKERDCGKKELTESVCVSNRKMTKDIKVQETNELKPNFLAGAGPSEKTCQSPQTTVVTATLCALCCSRPKEASFVHGRTSHQISCYPCAKKIYKNRGTCPVCRRRIEKITKHFIF